MTIRRSYTKVFCVIDLQGDWNVICPGSSPYFKAIQKVRLSTSAARELLKLHDGGYQSVKEEGTIIDGQLVLDS